MRKNEGCRSKESEKNGCRGSTGNVEGNVGG